MPLVGPNALLSPLAPMTLPALLKTIAHFAALFFYQSTALGALFAGRTKRSTLFHFHVEAFGSENIFLMRARLGWPPATHDFLSLPAPVPLPRCTLHRRKVR